MVPQLVTEEERRCRSRGCAVGDSDHRAGRRAEGRRSCRRREGREARCRQGGDKAADKGEKKEEVNRLVIRLVVGLGNPGKEYERTRHNAGFWLVERFAAQANGVVLRKDPKFKALVGKHRDGGWLLLPQSFMNLSGQPVQMLAGFFRIKPRKCWWCTTKPISRRAPCA